MDTRKSLNSFDTHIQDRLAYKYEVQNLIGKGGMANVYKAIQKGLDREVAIKVIHPSLIHDQEAVKRFRLEAKSAARLNHNNIITIFDVDEKEDIVFICLEYLEGKDLSDVIKKKDRLRTDELMEIMIPISGALSEIHEKNLIHRDIKSSNIFVTDTGRPVLMDFGIASLKESSSGITLPGTVIGTPEYMSPEQANGEALGPESDIYSLGIVMYQCLSGSVPFSGDSPISTIIQISQGNIPALDKNKLEVPDWLHNIILKCLAKNPNDRFRTAKELMESLVNKKITTAKFDPGTQKIVLSYDEDIDKLKKLMNKAVDIDEKIMVLESSPETIKDIFNLKEEVEVLHQAKRRQEELNAIQLNSEHLFDKTKQALIKNKFDSFNESEDYIIPEIPLPLRSPLDKIHRLLFTNYIYEFGLQFKTLKASDDFQELMSAFDLGLVMLENCFELKDFLSLEDGDKTKVEKKIFGLYDEFSQELINVFSSEKLGKTERKVLYFSLIGLLKKAPESFNRSTELKKLLNELYNKHLYPNSKLFRLTAEESPKLEEEEIKAVKPSSRLSGTSRFGASGVSAKRQSKPVLKEETPKETPRPKPVVKAEPKPEPRPIPKTPLGFDELYNRFINGHIIANQQTRSLLASTNEQINENTLSRLLYLYYSPKLKNNGFHEISTNLKKLESEISKKLKDPGVTFERMIYNGDEISTDGFSTYQSIDSKEGLKEWDEDVKAHLQKLKESGVYDDLDRLSSILHHNFNQLLLLMKPYVLKSILQRVIK